MQKRSSDRSAAGAITLSEIARRANVSKSTASRALSSTSSHLVRDSTRRRVIRIATAAGYEPNLVAKDFRRGRTGTLAVAIADFSDTFIPAFMRGIHAATVEEGLIPMLAETRNEHDRLKETVLRFVSRKADAIIITGARLEDREFIDEISPRLPTVLAIRNFMDDAYTSVVHDDFRGGFLAAQHLAQLGHERVAQITGSMQASSFVKRLQGFRQGCIEYGLTEIASEPSPGGYGIEGGRLSAAELLGQDPPPTGIFTHTDSMAAGALDAVRATGLSCPDDVSIVGHSDSPFSSLLFPPLTTIRLRNEEAGLQTGRLVRELLADRDRDPEVVSLPVELVQRSSTAPLVT